MAAVAAGQLQQKQQDGTSSNSNAIAASSSSSGYDVPALSGSTAATSTAVDDLLASSTISRSSTNANNADSLPFNAPLSHSIFLTEPFSASSFLLSRKHMSLEDLRSELRSYLAILRADLVAIINSDYEDFVSLGGARLLGTSSSAISTSNVPGKGAEEDTLGLRMRGPLERCGNEVSDAREELATLQGKLRTAMDRRDAIRERKMQCRKLLGVNEQIAKVEEMLLIQQPEQTQTGKALTVQTTGLAKTGSMLGGGLRKVSPMHKKLDRSVNRRAQYALLADSNLRRSMGSDTKRLERIAHEYSQLLYLTRKSEGLRFVETLQPVRIAF